MDLIVDDPNQSIDLLIKRIFNPTKKRSSLLSIIKKLPHVDDFERDDVERLESYGYIVTIPLMVDKRITITPEGIINLINYQNNFSGTIALKETAYNCYRKFCFHKIERLKKREKLKAKHIAVLLFFLLNGSIGPEKSYKVTIPSDLVYLEKIVGSFISENYEIGNEYALDYYLVEAKRILGDVAFNKKPNYYLKKENLQHVLDSIRKQVKGNISFSLSWKRLKESYRENATYLRSKGNSFYTTTWEMELDNLF